MNKTLLKIVSKITKTFSKIEAPFIHKYIKYDHVLEVKPKLRVGDIILVRTNGFLSTWLIPGYWKHVAIYVGDGKIIHATTKGVKEDYLVNLFMSTDNVKVLRPHNTTAEILHKIRKYCYSKLDTPYDFSMYANDVEQLYCSELVYFAYKYAYGYEYVDLRNTIGFKTITPEDLSNAEKKFDKIYEVIYKK